MYNGAFTQGGFVKVVQMLTVEGIKKKKKSVPSTVLQTNLIQCNLGNL